MESPQQLYSKWPKQFNTVGLNTGVKTVGIDPAHLHGMQRVGWKICQTTKNGGREMVTAIFESLPTPGDQY